MGAEDLVMHPPCRHAHILQLSFDCFHERDRAAEIVVGVGRNEVGDLLQRQSAAEVVILSFDILLPRLPIPDPALQFPVLPALCPDLVPERVVGAVFAGVKPANIHIRALGQQVVSMLSMGVRPTPAEISTTGVSVTSCRKKSPAGGMMSTVSPM